MEQQILPPTHNYSENMAQLDRIVTKLQQGTDLEETLQLFEQGKKLYQACAMAIKAAESALETHEKDMSEEALL